MALSAKQIVYPVYNEQVIDKTTAKALLYFGLHSSDTASSPDGADNLTEKDSSLAIKVQYLSMLFQAFLIISNVQSFLRKVLITLKYILRDNEI